MKNLIIAFPVTVVTAIAFSQNGKSLGSLKFESDLRIPHEYHVSNSGHIWEYWRTWLRNGLEFISETFHR